MQIVWEELRRRVTLAGTVRSPNGESTGAIAVTATPGERTRRKSAGGFVATGARARTVSKGNGCFGFVDLPHGVYRVTARCDAWDADRFVSLEGHVDVDVDPFDPAATPLPHPAHVEIVLAARTPDDKARGVAARKVPPIPTTRPGSGCPGTRVIEFD